MSQAKIHPLEGMLRAIAREAPRPWYPRLHAERTGTAPDSLYILLELLWLDGLVEKGSGTTETGPGVVLTERGGEVLRDEELLQRLCDGKALAEDDRGGMVREVVRRQTYPLMTRILILSNVLVFAWGLWLAYPNAIGDFLGALFNANAKVIRILHQTGALWPQDLLDGQWWRLLSCCWVHVGLLHLAMTMYMLYGSGSYVEQMYGPWRYLLLYLVAGFCGSCVQMTRAVPEAGASAAICGVFAAEAVWVLVNGKYLPRQVKRRWKMNLLSTFLLLAFISLFPRVGGLAHLGGAIAGAIAGLLLSWQRFGLTPLRWLAVPALAVLPWAGLHLLNNARATRPEWQELERAEQERERSEFKDRLKKTNEILQDAYAYCNVELGALRRHGPAEREQDQILQALARQRQHLLDLNGKIQKAGPYRNEEVEKARQLALAYIARLLDWMDALQTVATAGDKVTPKDLEQLKARDKAADRLRAEWEKLAGVLLRAGR